MTTAATQEIRGEITEELKKQLIVEYSLRDIDNYEFRLLSLDRRNKEKVFTHFHLHTLSTLIGGLTHRADVFTVTRDFGQHIDKQFLSNRAKSLWLLRNRSEYVPPSAPDGTPPNEHTISASFEYHYHFDITLRSEYIVHLVHSLPK